MFTKSDMLVAAYKRYMQPKEERLLPQEHLKQYMKSQTSNEEFYITEDSEEAMYYYSLCFEMDNNGKSETLELLNKSILKEREDTILEQAKNDILRTESTNKHKWVEVFEIIKNKMIQLGNRPSSISDKYARIKLIFELAKTEYIEDITKIKAAEIKNLLFKLPKNFKNFKEKSIEEIYKKHKKVKPISKVTVNNYLTHINQLYEVAIDEELTKTNPFRKLKLKRTKTDLIDINNSRYQPFTLSELKQIFNPDNYPTPDQTSKFYIPIIAYCQGMRLNEICQLQVNDIVSFSKDNYAFVIKEDSKQHQRTKNKSSIRKIPFHPILKQIGFFNFIKELKKTKRKGLIFNDFCKLSKTGYYSVEFSKYFSKYLRRIGIKKSVKVFHSFRHTFRVDLANAKIATEVSNALGGWSASNIGESYANNFSLSMLFKAIKQTKKIALKKLFEKYFNLSVDNVEAV